MRSSAGTYGWWLAGPARRRAAIVAIVLAGCLAQGPGFGGRASGQAAHRIITATMRGGYFVPFIVTARAGDTVVWRNTDGKAHSLTAALAPGSAEGSVFPLTVAPNAERRATFARAGVYDLYSSADATYNPKLARVAARAGEPPYPVPMEQIIVVMGPGFEPAPRAAETVVAPGDYFRPFITVVRPGGSVTFRNADTDAHVATGVPSSPDPFPKTLTVMGGKSATVEFPKPGVYFYYCSLHAAYRSAYGRAAANTSADAYPVAMEGLVVVATP